MCQVRLASPGDHSGQRGRHRPGAGRVWRVAELRDQCGRSLGSEGENVSEEGRRATDQGPAGRAEEVKAVTEEQIAPHPSGFGRSSRVSPLFGDRLGGRT